jgi:gamma-glutamylcyclotransferase (GGCT)/AIG2-like uncharacterized protein YtfP
MSEPEPQADSGPGPSRSPWVTPAGISALAGVAGVLVIVVGWFVTGELRNAGGSEPPGSGASAPQTAQEDDAENRLFVYGTSMPGQAGHHVVERYVDSSRRDQVEGLLFDSGRGYPLATFEPGGTIRGYVLELDEATQDDAKRAMTQYEGGMFHPVEVRTESGTTAIAYEWIGDTAGFPRIDVWDSSLAGYGQEAPVNTLVLDDCFDLSATAGMGITVNCEAPHQFKVYHRDVFTDTAFPGLQALEATANTECSRWFEAHYGTAVDPASTRLYFPSEASWAEGDRALVCAAAP